MEGGRERSWRTRNRMSRDGSGVRGDDSAILCWKLFCSVSQRAVSSSLEPSVGY